MASVLALRSTLAGDGPPLFFPDPEVPAIFDFDQGLAAPETFPREDLMRISRLVLERDGPEVLDYFDPAPAMRNWSTAIRACAPRSPSGSTARRTARSIRSASS